MAVPPITAIRIGGIQRLRRSAAKLIRMVAMAAITGSAWMDCPVVNTTRSVCATDSPRGRSSPSSVPTWLLTISTAAPAVKPAITACGTSSTHLPTRAIPSSNCSAPTTNVSVSTRPTYCELPTAASGATSAMVVSEMALAGPVTIRRLLPNSAAITHGIIAA